MGYIKALRLPICILAGFLTLLGFQLIVGKTDKAYLPALSVFMIACSTMIWNDFRDRLHDLKKGKDFASKHAKTFLIYALSLWLVSISLSILLGILYNFRFFALTLGMILAGFIYSETRRIPFVPNTLVALTSASPSLFPALIGFHKSPNLWLLFVATFLAIYAREIAKDFDDIKIDKSHKWTLLQWMDPQGSIKVMIFLLGIATILTLFLGTTAFFTLIFMYLVFFAMCQDLFELTAWAKAAKYTLDAGIFFLMSSLFICPIP